MNYATARDHIEDGDLIAVRGKHGVFAALTRFFTRSAYTHCGVALWIEGGLWMAELNGGRNHAIPMSQLEDGAFDVYWPPIREVEKIRVSILSRLRVKIDYGTVATIAIGLLNFLRIKLFVHWRQFLVCSGYCVAIYEDAGWSEHSRILSPQDLTELLALKFEVRP